MEDRLYACPVCSEELVITPGARGATRVCPTGCGRAATMEILRRHCLPGPVGEAWQQAMEDPDRAGRACCSCGHPTSIVQVGPRAEARGELCRSCHLVYFEAAAWDALPHKPPEKSTRRFSERNPIGSAPPVPEPEPPVAPPADPPAEPVQQTMPWVEPEEEVWTSATGGRPTHQGLGFSYARIPGARQTRGVVTWGVIASLAIVGVATLPMPDATQTFGFRPSEPSASWGLPLLASFYVHASLTHLLVSLYFLAALGDRVEAVLGPRRYLSTLLAATVAGLLAYAVGGPTMTEPLVGAGGGISGLILLYALASPRARVSFLVFFDEPRLSVWTFLGLWILVLLVGDFTGWGTENAAPFVLHLAGAFVGLAGAVMMGLEAAARRASGVRR